MHLGASGWGRGSWAHEDKGVSWTTPLAVGEFFLPALCPALLALGGKRMPQVHVSLGCFLSGWTPNESPLLCALPLLYIVRKTLLWFLEEWVYLGCFPPPPALPGWRFLWIPGLGSLPSFRIVRKQDTGPLCCPSYPGGTVFHLLIVYPCSPLSLTAGCTVQRGSQVVFCMNGRWRKRLMPSFSEE